MNTLLSFLPDYSGLWAGLGLSGIVGIGVLAFLFPAFGAVLKTIVDALSPLVIWVGHTIAQVVKWVWDNILWPGLQDIFDSWPTIATVGAAAYILWAALSMQASLQIEAMRGQANSCRVEVSKLQKTAKGLETQLKKAQKQQSTWGW